MSGPPLFRADAKALADEVAAVLAAAFPVEEPGYPWAEQARADGLTYTERLERVAFMVAGEQRRVLAATVHLATAEPEPFADAEDAEWSLHAEVAALLQVAGMTAEARVEDARTLAQRLPATLAKLRAGELSTAKAFVMLEETANLDAPEAARVDVQAMKNTRGTRSQFRTRVRRLIAKIDPAAVNRKREQARKHDVGVTTFEAEDGLNAINARIPAEDAARCWTAITERAGELTVPSDPRGINQLRAAAFIDLLTNRPDGTPRVTWQVQALVPVGTLLGLTDHDAHIPGHGAVPADRARDIAGRAGEVRRSLFDPDTGALLDVTSSKYRPQIKTRTRILKPADRPNAEDPCAHAFGGPMVRAPEVEPITDDPTAHVAEVGGPRADDLYAHGAAAGGPLAGRPITDDPHAPGAHPTPASVGGEPLGAVPRVQIPGLGPLPTEVAELIAGDPEWQRLLTDPDTSARLDDHPDTYRPGIPLARFIRLRDQHCRWPGCRRAARHTDVDHTIPHGKPGGLTIRRNLACFCRRHHQIKQLPGWKVVQGDHGELSFTTPTGRSYRTRPPNPDGSEDPVEEL